MAASTLTGGVVVILGPTGRSFAAGMGEGIAFIYDPDDVFRDRCNTRDGRPRAGRADYKDIGLLSNLVNRHVLYTGSKMAEENINDYPAAQGRFVKVFPSDYRRVLEQSKIVQRQWELING